jgi:hypothetical protein
VGTGPDGGEALGNRAWMGRGAYRAGGDEAPAAPATTGDGRRGAGEQDACAVASSELRNNKKRNGQRDGTGWRWWCAHDLSPKNRKEKTSAKPGSKTQEGRGASDAVDGLGYRILFSTQGTI